MSERGPSANRLAFARLVARPEGSLDLASGCLHIAAEAQDSHPVNRAGRSAG